MKKIITITFIFLYFGFSQAQIKKESKINPKVYLSYEETDSTTVILDLYNIESIYIKGKWEHVPKKGELRHDIVLKCNDTMLGFFPYPKKLLKNMPQESSDKLFLEEFINKKYKDWDDLNLKFKLIKSKPGSYYVFHINKKITLIGIKGTNSYFIDFLEPLKSTDSSKVNYLIHFFNEIR